LPVTGECELVSAEITGPGEHDAPHVAGWISHDGNVIEVLDVSALTTPQEALHKTGEPVSSHPSSSNSASSVFSVPAFLSHPAEDAQS
jgi:hypothetical protein